MSRKITTLAGVIIAATGMVATMTTAVQASPTERATDSSAVAVSPELLSAMQRDLGLTAEQARTRLANEDRANRLEGTLRGRLADRFGGAWLSADGAKLTVAVTDSAQAAAVRAAGAEATVVARSERQLDGAVAKLDAAEAQAPAGVAGWYVDVKTNKVVVVAQAKAATAAATFASAAGLASDAVRVEVSSEAPRTFYDVRGGDAFYMGGGRCSVGFSVAGGFVTAGHCGRAGTATQGFNRVAQGTFRGSSFPGNDYAWVAVNANWVPRGIVNRYSGNVTVAGSTVAAIGASICRSGSTTGWRCGTVQARNQTVRYPQGSVSGLTRTNACAQPGDSGGSWMSGSQAQGVTSGGSGNCTSGGTTYFQPVNEILSAYGLRLVTGG